MPWRSKAAGQVGNGWVGAARSPGTSLGGTSRSSISHTGLPVTRSKTKAKACLVTWATPRTRLPPTVASNRLGAVGGS